MFFPKKTLSLSICLIVLCLLNAYLTSCSLPIKLEWDDPADEARSLITPGETDKKQVRQCLGEPFIALEDWGLEVYKVEGGWYKVFVVGIAGVPAFPGIVPGAVTDEGELSTYVLVVYEDNIVSAVDFGTDEEYKPTLEANGFEYTGFYEVITAPEKFRSTKEAPKSDKDCSFFVPRFFDFEITSNQVYLDNKEVAEMKGYGFYNFYISEGVHEIDIYYEYGGGRKSSYASKTITCANSEDVYLDVKDLGGFFSKPDLEISTHNVPPKSFKKGQLIIYPTWER